MTKVSKKKIEVSLRSLLLTSNVIIAFLQGILLRGLQKSVLFSVGQCCGSHLGCSRDVRKGRRERKKNFFFFFPSLRTVPRRHCQNRTGFTSNGSIKTEVAEWEKIKNNNIEEKASEESKKSTGSLLKSPTLLALSLKAIDQKKS